MQAPATPLRHTCIHASRAPRPLTAHLRLQISQHLDEALDRAKAHIHGRCHLPRGQRGVRPQLCGEAVTRECHCHRRHHHQDDLRAHANSHTYGARAREPRESHAMHNGSVSNASSRHAVRPCPQPCFARCHARSVGASRAEPRHAPQAGSARAPSGGPEARGAHAPKARRAPGRRPCRRMYEALVSSAGQGRQGRTGRGGAGEPHCEPRPGSNCSARHQAGGRPPGESRSAYQIPQRLWPAASASIGRRRHVDRSSDSFTRATRSVRHAACQGLTSPPHTPNSDGFLQPRHSLPPREPWGSKIASCVGW